MPGRNAGKVALLCVVAGLARAEDGGAPTAIADPVEIYLDGGDCDTGTIEIEVFERERAEWIPHPHHPLVAVPSCQSEDAGGLLNEFRWRCATGDPAAPAPWRHLPVFDPEVFSRCVLDRILERERERIHDARSKRLELEAEAGGE